MFFGCFVEATLLKADLIVNMFKVQRGFLCGV